MLVPNRCAFLLFGEFSWSMLWITLKSHERQGDGSGVGGAIEGVGLSE